jgi:hypothetical protein
MDKVFLYLLVAICIVYGGCKSSGSGSEPDALPASALHAFGRTFLTDSGHIELISSAAHVGFSFTGTQCEIAAYINDPTGHLYLQYELDGTYQKRIKISGDSIKPIVIAAPENGAHTVWLFKATEALTGPIFIEKITGQGLKALQRPKAPLIEFIGNSITCGAAADPSEVACDAGVYHDQHNAYMAYGPRVARALKANFILSSVSGIGIYRNWNSDGPTMPQVYDKSDFQYEGTRQWKFESYKPDVVSIALGTNDYSDGDGTQPRLPFDSVVYVNNYIKFVQHVKSKYPEATIALLSSPMINGESRLQLQNCLTAVKQVIDGLYPAAKPVAVFFLNQCRQEDAPGILM